MFKKSINALLATWLTGLIVLLPLALSLTLLTWVVGLLNQAIGPSSYIGQVFAAMGRASHSPATPTWHTPWVRRRY